MMNMEKAPVPEQMDLADSDRWRTSGSCPRSTRLAKDVTENMDKYELGIAVQKIYDFIWEEFCDWYIEMVKPRLYNEEDTDQGSCTVDSEDGSDPMP